VPGFVLADSTQRAAPVGSCLYRQPSFFRGYCYMMTAVCCRQVAAAPAGGRAPAVCSLGLPLCTLRHVTNDSCGWMFAGNLLEMTARGAATAGMRAWPRL
jgi:hypothetical protein